MLLKELIDQIIFYYHLGNSITKISKLLNLSYHKVEYCLHDNGYTNLVCNRSLYKLKDKVEEFIKQYPILSMTAFCAQNHINDRTFSKVLKELGYNDLIQNVPNCDETVFDVIDTEEKAYWLGFWYADGYVASLTRKSNYIIGCSLAYKDLEHLEKFAKFIKFQNKLYEIDAKCGDKRFKTIKFLILNKHLWESLNKLGCCPKKSLVIKFPDVSVFQSKDLIRHFIRGYFDGDGCLTNSSTGLSQMSIVSGSAEFLEVLNTYLPITCKFTQSKPNLYTLAATDNKKLHRSFINLTYLYKDANIYLNRKYDRYLKYCRLYEQLLRSLSGKIGEDCDVNTEVNSSKEESL